MDPEAPLRHDDQVRRRDRKGDEQAGEVPGREAVACHQDPEDLKGDDQEPAAGGADGPVPDRPGADPMPGRTHPDHLVRLEVYSRSAHVSKRATVPSPSQCEASSFAHDKCHPGIAYTLMTYTRLMEITTIRVEKAVRDRLAARGHIDRLANGQRGRYAIGDRLFRRYLELQACER